MRILLMEKGLSLFLQALGEIVEYLCAHRSLSGPLYQSRAWFPPSGRAWLTVAPPSGRACPAGAPLSAGI